MSRPPYLVYDTLDDRREVHQLLARLSPSRRLAYLAWCCRQGALLTTRAQPHVAQRTRALAELARRDASADRRLTFELFVDFWHLTAQYDLPVDRAVLALTDYVRGRPLPPGSVVAPARPGAHAGSTGSRAGARRLYRRASCPPCSRDFPRIDPASG